MERIEDQIGFGIGARMPGDDLGPADDHHLIVSGGVKVHR
jgi:hypothetical protein